MIGGNDVLETGSHLGKYEILRRLAIGGMAEIYLARVSGTAGFEKLVVLKRILPAVAKDTALVEMFLDEARLAATLRHPNIADVFDVGAESGTHFFAMEYVYGQDLRAIRYASQQRRIPIEIALVIACATASALAYAHDRTGPDGPLGLVHRDVSPSNILVSYDGAVKLVDFGIARASSRTSKTLTGTLKGKVPYMSPEQCRGKVLDRRSDLFSLGIVLFELTTGERPFRGPSEYETLEQIVTTTPRPPTSFVAGYPMVLEAIVMKLLVREPGDRYQTADAALADLESSIAELGAFISPLGVTKYMRELFAGEIGAWEMASEQGVTLAHHLAANPVTELKPDTEFQFDEPTAPFDRRITAQVEPLLTSELRITFRAPTIAPPVARTITKPTWIAPEETHHDIILPFDPVDARSAEILDGVDAGAPFDESVDDRTRRRISTLVECAIAWCGTNELDKSVIAIELALSEDPDSVVAQKLVQRNHDAIMIVLETFIGDPAQMPYLARPLDQLASVSLEQRVAFLLSRIHGRTSVTDLVHTSGMTPLETYRRLCGLLLRGVLLLAPPELTLL